MDACERGEPSIPKELLVIYATRLYAQRTTSESNHETRLSLDGVFRYDKVSNSHGNVYTFLRWQAGLVHFVHGEYLQLWVVGKVKMRTQYSKIYNRSLHMDAEHVRRVRQHRADY